MPMLQLIILGLAAFPLFGRQLYNGLGYHWASSLLGFVAVAMAPLPYVFFRVGPQVRRQSRFTTQSS